MLGYMTAYAGCKQLNKEGKTIIIVTHDMQVANQCNRILRMQDGHLAEAE